MQEPPDERTEHYSDLGGEGNVSERAYENAECQPDHRADH